MDKDRVAGSAKKIKAEGKADKIEGKVQNAVGGLKINSFDEVEGNQPAKNVACQRRNDRRGPFLRPGGGISECKPHFANKTCQAEPLAKAQRR